jgi:hypothetical protein
MAAFTLQNLDHLATSFGVRVRKPLECRFVSDSSIYSTATEIYKLECCTADKTSSDEHIFVSMKQDQT